jgi:rare lipoprotein A
MKKLIPVISVIAICSYFFNPISNAEAARHSHARHHSKHTHHTGHHSDGKHGSASWYGSEFHGKRTANGERFDMYAMTAAHRTLPLSSYAAVTNLKNQRTVIVRINDRGPFHGNRVMDLSYAAAKELGIQKRGTGSIKITPLVINDDMFQVDNHPG